MIEENKKLTKRQEAIRNCKVCNGNPPQEEFKIEGHISGIKCGKCSEVINWKKE